MQINVLSHLPSLYSNQRFLQEGINLNLPITIVPPLRENLTKLSQASLCLLRLGEYSYFETMTLLQQLPLRYFNSLESFQLARDKWATYEFLLSLNICPHSQLTPLPLPCLVKLRHSLQGRGVFLVQTPEELLQIQNQHQNIFYQQFIATAAGTDYRLLFIKNQYIGAIQRHNSTSFKANIHQGGQASPWLAPTPLIEQGTEIASKLNLHYCGLDFIRTENGEFLFLEANASLGFEAFEKATQINFAKLLLESLTHEF
ncbi:MAG: RimK family alpha-L-glutamate ligase [Bdellovibrionia bacterium]